MVRHRIPDCTPRVHTPHSRKRTPALGAGWRTPGRCGLRICMVLFAFMVCHATLAVASEKWPGVDEAVIEKYAKEQGREIRAPFINTDQGDLLLFAFLLAGAIGGFVAGYYWRMLIVEKPSAQEKEAEQVRTEGR